jgi:chromosome partitioning protein
VKKHQQRQKTMINVVNEGYGKLVFHTVIRKNTAIGEAVLQQQDIFSYQPKSAGAEDYTNLAKEILLMK